MHTRIIPTFLCGAALLAISGCSVFKGLTSSAEESSHPNAAVALTGHNPVSLHNYKTARSYSMEGRLELAREHYLLAYAAAEDDLVLRDMLEKELKAVDMMIKTLR